MNEIFVKRGHIEVLRNNKKFVPFLGIRLIVWFWEAFRCLFFSYKQTRTSHVTLSRGQIQLSICAPYFGQDRLLECYLFSTYAEAEKFAHEILRLSRLGQTE